MMEILFKIGNKYLYVHFEIEAPITTVQEMSKKGGNSKDEKKSGKKGGNSKMLSLPLRVTKIEKISV
jgi:hypothetical protein